jgi:transposase
VPNTDPGIAQLVSALTKLAPTLVVCEATGVYHRPLLAALVAANIPVAVANPAQVAAFRQARLGREKSDHADARLLARFAQVHGDDLRRAGPSDPTQTRLRDLVAYRDGLVAEQTRLRNRQHANAWAGEPTVRAWLAADQAAVTARLAEVDAAIAQLLTELPEAAVLRELTGVGPRVTAAVLAYLPRGLWGDAKAAAAYAGVHPRREQSGQRDNSRLSKQGHARLRRYLYMAATVALRHDADLAAFHARLMQRGKAHRSATCAIMHKLLRRMMGRLRAYYAAHHATPDALAA